MSPTPIYTALYDASVKYSTQLVYAFLIKQLFHKNVSGRLVRYSQTWSPPRQSATRRLKARLFRRWADGMFTLDAHYSDKVILMRWWFVQRNTYHSMTYLRATIYKYIYICIHKRNNALANEANYASFAANGALFRLNLADHRTAYAMFLWYNLTSVESIHNALPYIHIYTLRCRTVQTPSHHRSCTTINKDKVIGFMTHDMCSNSARNLH